MTESLSPIRHDDKGWRREVPALIGSVVVLRELRQRDAPSLYDALGIPQVDSASLTAPYANDPDGFLKFIERAQRQRAEGERICFAAVPRGCDLAIGFFELRAIESGFRTAEWRFALAPEFWGSGVFPDGARLAIDFLFQTIGARRLEARAAVTNARASGALSKVGAVQEARLRGTPIGGRAREEYGLWTIHADEWQTSRAGLSLH